MSWTVDNPGPHSIEALARALHDRPDVCGCGEWPCTDGVSAAYWRNDAADLSKLLREAGFQLGPSDDDLIDALGAGALAKVIRLAAHDVKLCKGSNWPHDEDDLTAERLADRVLVRLAKPGAE